MADNDDIRTAVHSMYTSQQQQQQYHHHNPYQQFNHHQLPFMPVHGGSGFGGSGSFSIPRSQSHMVNLLSEDFIAGYMDEGRMSVVRRFFCLFVTFDMVFISLLWIICVMITGDNIFHALQTQVVHYTIYTSLFDVVVIAIIRFLFLIFFYGLCHLNHWIVIALSTTGSCAFLIYKVFVYNWTATPQPVFEVLLIVVSFVLAWGEAWFLDCRVIPQERYARNYYVAITNPSVEAQTPLLAPFLNSAMSGRTESVGNFYSPYDSIHNSDDEEDEQDEEFKKMGIECVRKAYALLESTNWKLEKVTSKGDTIQSCQQDKVGKIYKLTAKINFPAKRLLQELYYKIEEVPNWNPTLLESKIIRKIDSHTDISYQATIGGGGGVVKCRDFVNLRCWQLCREGRVIEGIDLNPPIIDPSALSPVTEEMDDEEEESTETDEECILGRPSPKITKSCSEFKLGSSSNSVSDGSESKTRTAFSTLSKSLGAQDFQHGANSDPEDVFSEALDEQPQAKQARSRKIDSEVTKGGNVYVSAAISIEYPGAPVTTKYIRGENKVSCWAMREIENQKDHCIFEWLLCLDLKGYIPRYVLDTAYTTLMQDYMTHLRNYVADLKRQGKVPKSNITSSTPSSSGGKAQHDPKVLGKSAAGEPHEA
ncbi:steroidogenic acute regulatory protein-like [Uranotaenia lowii]|uniref:steroidogenic acute regulatory protein-like n=1 Tax=Uranotaenia lowii TaxID=190385 RepID=UPI0024796D14|nr:steroidogenic acute regulatory protein-like [Uranotaenia lowii]XP_055609891.1 steroidogenic acute regulatory protein-like [Uranotaenia lowii]XP_055609892.1 steroidogenic acute regulatory protein-like [Uranotaenia lowii]XP_055609893.1 steroidogenic acute regulatory protein-like [Uranotaenia lowii]